MEKDITTNSLIENNDVFADIANVNIFGGQMMIKQDDLESVPIDASYKDLKGKHHRLFRDTLKKVKNIGGCIAFLGYESQTEINNVMPVRNMGYNYTVYMKQIQDITAGNNRNRHSVSAKVIHDDQKLMPVATFILYFGQGKWEKPLALMDILDIPEKDKEFWKVFIDDFKIKVIHMADQSVKIREKYQSDYRIIADYLAYRKSKEDLNIYLRKDRRKLIHVEQLLDMLHALSGDRRFGIMKEQYLTIEDKEECNNMCLLLDMCEEEGIQKGMQKGILLAAQVIRLNSGGKDENEISRELGADLSVVEDILSSFRESAEV